MRPLPPNPHPLPSADSRVVGSCRVAQFGANNAHQLATAAAMIQEHVDGVDINMGCPQRSAMRDGMVLALPHPLLGLHRTVAMS
eukprot:COSAG04_NODE_497_length_13410_cov_6.004658_12_plen_84_part_00